MANISNYLEEIILDWVFKANSKSSTPPQAVYLGLAVDEEGVDAELEDGDFTNEITGYTGNRKLITFGDIAQDNDGRATIKNYDEIEFASMPAVTVGYAFISDSATKGEGNVLWWMQVAEPKIMNNGDTLRVPAENIVIMLD
ncbi:MAG: hypothetical protein PHZ19_05720 [Candidatus Thermoplasmatota archaeon]|nr:hypothetical protein [Candidatus Thermoplasmatota archaeon]